MNSSSTDHNCLLAKTKWMLYCFLMVTMVINGSVWIWYTHLNWLLRCINPKFEILTISWTRSGPSGHNKSIVRTKFCFSNVGSKKKDKMEIMSLLLTFYKIKRMDEHNILQSFVKLYRIEYKEKYQLLLIFV